ncbi:NAD(P)H-dependent oxidoreductase subunit E [Carboxydochorda subterranea]|uniref:NAD(P)H-dependent oxidoreductase subunit E n=1 Tax=Carboxydichorda subterranea TaxID=3109565 RepID=A0ABZ1BX07_9FIRM|nr:NAD(P)H-dependent oxidoreductase subunit E [Limnochorda sp. L945t]WRP17336.1 NAD(P)H-dependent oxidoreductase subunit E [Limnochorda sp. L945t]
MSNRLGQSGRGTTGLLAALRDEQVRRGYLSPEALMRIAAERRLSPSVVYGVATFYHEFLIGNVRELVIRVCDSPSCHLAGSELLIEQLERLVARLPGPVGGSVDELEHRAPAVRIERVGCLGQCDRSPAVIIGSRLYLKVQSRELPLLLQRALAGGDAAAPAPAQGGDGRGHT